MSLPWKPGVPFPISEFEMLARRKRRTDQNPCAVFCSDSQQCVVGCCGEKPSHRDALREERQASPRPLLKAIMKLRVLWRRNGPSHSSCYSGEVSQNSGIYQGFAVSMWLLWLGLVCKTNKGSTIHRQLIVSLNPFTLIRSWTKLPGFLWVSVGMSQPLWASGLL